LIGIRQTFFFTYFYFSRIIKLATFRISRINTNTFNKNNNFFQIHEQRSAAAQCRLLAEEAEHSLEEQRRQLAVRSDELHTLEQSKARAEQRLAEAHELARGLRDECSALRTTVAALDKDKDRLVASLDERTVESVTLKQELAAKHRRIDELSAQLAQLDAALDNATDELKAKGKELVQVRIQIKKLNNTNKNPNKKPGNPNKKEFLFGLSTQKLENPGNPNKNYEIRGKSK
jgi:chromosome segregation ATPase